MKFLAASVVLALGLAGCTSPPVILERTMTLGPGTFAEVNLVIQGGQVVSWEWSVEGPALLFNVHSHIGEAVTEHVSKTGTSDVGSFTAPASGTYSLMWETGGASAMLSYKLTGESKLDPAHPPVP